MTRQNNSQQYYLLNNKLLKHNMVIRTNINNKIFKYVSIDFVYNIDRKKSRLACSVKKNSARRGFISEKTVFQELWTIPVFLFFL